MILLASGISLMIKDIERKMLNYAKELQFEKAALLRDQLNKIKTNKDKL